MSDRKTIQINPELFMLPSGGGRTRKRNPKVESDKIRVRNQEKEKKPKNISILKRNILKMIRNHQYDKKKDRDHDQDPGQDQDHNHNQNTIMEPRIISSFETDFDNSLKFLSSLATDVEKQKQNHHQNHTIRRYPSTSSSPSPSPSPSIEMPYIIQPNTLPTPKYGCLKNGSLPTYRSWINQTQKNRPEIQPAMPMPIQKPITIINHSNIPTNFPTSNLNQNLNPITDLDNKIKEISRISQFEKQNQREKKTGNISKYRFPKQKKTIRRTYFIGKSRIHPKVSVLVSNKSIRANTTLKKQALKNVPIAEVRKYLLKHGFIKVGTNSPNDVLREMYENAKLICGEVKNHNPENLLYNYFHAAEEL